MSRQQPVQIILAAEAEGDLQAIYNQRLAQRGAEGLDGAEALLDRNCRLAAALVAAVSHHLYRSGRCSYHRDCRRWSQGFRKPLGAASIAKDLATESI